MVLTWSEVASRYQNFYRLIEVVQSRAHMRIHHHFDYDKCKLTFSLYTHSDKIKTMTTKWYLGMTKHERNVMIAKKCWATTKTAATPTTQKKRGRRILQTAYLKKKRLAHDIVYLNVAQTYVILLTIAALVARNIRNQNRTEIRFRFGIRFPQLLPV